MIFRFDQEFDVTVDEHLLLINNECATLLGVFVVLDHQSVGLVGFVDVATVFSCDALKAGVSDIISMTDSGDGHCSKEEVGVSRDMKRLLNGSKFVGKEIVPEVKKILRVHGIMREIAKLVHTKMRADLNSRSKPSVWIVLIHLATALRDLGECSFARAQRNLSSIVRDDLKSILGEIFGKECPTDASLVSSYIGSLTLFSGRDYDKCAHEINVLFSLVWKIVAWELVTVYVVLEDGELIEKMGNVNGENSKVDRKKNKKKNKEGVSKKGTRLTMDFIKERLQSDVENSRLLELGWLIFKHFWIWLILNSTIFY